MANGRDKKDEIINLQLDLIRKMTENNIKRLSDDIWGSTRTNANPPQKPQTSAKTGTPAAPQNPAPVKPAQPSDADLIKASGSGDGAKPAEPEETLPEKENIDDLRKELDSYIGLDEVKKEVKSLINMATVYKMRRDNNLPTADVSLHMVFSGNPGTGKTMIARFMARVYHSLGILSKGQLVEVDRSGLVAGYIGQTAIKTAKVLEGAIGGVLFIDEAYTLTAKTENDFGFEAVDTILKSMEDNRDDLVVIVAGYIDLMEDFIDSNPGLRSRFNKYIRFDDYSADEMMGIFDLQCKKSCYMPDDEAKAALKEYFTAVSEAAGEFGNARGVRNTFERLLTEQANRVAGMTDISRDDLMTITKADVDAALYPKEETEE
ncbi:MAG: AAA family ATPase [Ruminococcaceae bacterium]|nr:AAA family ATPase [Oscillospiraceae bacterium]